MFQKQNEYKSDLFIENNWMKQALGSGILVVPMLYLASAVSSIYINDVAGTAIISWCATCAFLAVLFRNKKQLWCPIVICATIGDVAAHLLMHTPILAVFGIVLADVFEVCFTAVMFKRLNRGKRWYLSVRIVTSLTIVSLFASVLSTSFEYLWISGFVSAPEQPYIKARSLTEALDLLVALPLALSWTDSSLLSTLSIQKFTQIIILTATTAAASYFLLASGTPYLFMAIPLLLLATLSSGLLGSTAAVFSLSLVVRWLTFDGPGRIISSNGTESAGLLVVYHLFVITALLSSVPLGVLLARIENSAHRLREAGIAAEHALQEAEAARDRAETAGRAKSDFLSVMSHELRTPMTGVLGLVDLLSKENLTKNQKNYLDKIRESGRHLLNVINDILDFSRIDSGKLEIESMQFSVAAVLQSVCDTTRPLCRDKGINFLQDFDPTMPDFVIGDPTRMQQILLNLVGNAIKFTDHGTVRLVARHDLISDCKIRLRFEIHDTGIGISKENQPEIFNAFTQEDRSTARRYGGSGLGLAICRRLVTAMDGDISFTSSLGAGSIFRFEIPVSMTNNRNVELTANSTQIKPRPIRMLIAEDVALNRSIIRSMLSADEHTLVFAQTGVEAVEWARQGNFDLILMDIQMPVMDGVQATQQIRSLPGRVKDVPIIALTANVLENERRRYLEAGMDSCIAKPIDWDALNDAIIRCTVKSRLTGDDVPTSVNEPVGQSHLLDITKLQSLRDKIGAEIEPLFIRAIEHAEQIIVNIENCELIGESKHKEMHALKGMAGLLGFVGMQRLAGELETESSYGASAKAEGAELSEVVKATKLGLIRQGFLKDKN